MFIIHRIRIYNDTTKETQNTITTTLLFGELYQTEQFRRDMEHYERLHGNHELYAYFTIGKYQTP